MKTLILARHAHVATETELEYQDRHLTVTCVEQTYKAENLLHQQGLGSTHWFSIPVNRALYIAITFSKIFHTTSSIHIEKRLYAFSMNQLESIIRELNTNFENSILFAHNITITDFFNAFSNLPV